MVAARPVIAETGRSARAGEQPGESGNQRREERNPEPQPELYPLDTAVDRGCVGGHEDVDTVDLDHAGDGPAVGFEQRTGSDRAKSQVVEEQFVEFAR